MLSLKIGKSSIHIRFSFLFIVSLFLLLEQLSIGRKLLAAVLLHEIGHLLVLVLQGKAPQQVDCSLRGIVIHSGVRHNSFTGELLLHLAGPLMNLLCMALLWERDMFACAFHLILAAVNLLPIQPLDGGNITELLLEQILPPERVHTACRRVSFCALIVLFVCALPLLLHGKNPSLLLFALLLAAQNRK